MRVLTEAHKSSCIKHESIRKRRTYVRVYAHAADVHTGAATEDEQHIHLKLKRAAR